MIAARRELAWPTRRIVLWGLLWGLLLSAAEFVVLLPLHNAPPLRFLLWWLVVWPLPLWCAFGCVVLLLARHAERSGAWRMTMLAGLAAAIVWSAYQPLQTRLINAFWPSINIFDPVVWRTAQGEEFNAVFTTQPSALLSYNLWMSLFYGGLLVAGYALSMRGERTRAALLEAALARGRTEALLGELQLQKLQAQIDPAVLLAALAEVQRLYPQQSDRADALLERLVDFLRSAMPGLKQRDSTLRAELQLAEALARLQALMPGGARWRVAWPQSLPERAFPSLLLLPVMALATATDKPSLVVQVEDARLSLRVQGLGRGLPPNLEQHCRASLQALLGPRFRLRMDESPQTQLLIELDPFPTAKELEHEPGLS